MHSIALIFCSMTGVMSTNVFGLNSHKLRLVRLEEVEIRRDDPLKGTRHARTGSQETRSLHRLAGDRMIRVEWIGSRMGQNNIRLPFPEQISTNRSMAESVIVKG